MPGQVFEAQFKLPYFSNLPEDVIINTFHFFWGGASYPTTTELQQIVTRLVAFYGTIWSTAGANDLAGWVNKTACSCKIYDLGDPTPRVPRLSVTAPLSCAQSTGGGLPCEVSLCISYQGTPLAGVPQASRRGRIYIGGIGAGGTGGTTTSFPVPSLVLRGAASSAATYLKGISASTSWTWGVWSRKLGAFTAATNGWIDDAWDTQRRRGQAPSVRTLWS